MKAERIEVIGLNVRNLDEAIDFFSDILGTTFIKPAPGRRTKKLTDHADPAFESAKLKIAIDRTGYLELIESTPPLEDEGIRSFHVTVPDIEEAKAELKKKGIRLMADVSSSGFKEAIFHPDDLNGIRL